MFEQDIARRAQALEGITFGPYELLFDIFEGLEAFPAIDVAQVYRDMELLHATAQQVDVLNLRLEELAPNLDQSDKDALNAALESAFAPVQTAFDDATSFADHALRTGSGMAAYANNFFESAISAFAGITGISTAVDLVIFSADAVGDLLAKDEPVDTVLYEALREFVTDGINLSSDILSTGVSADASFQRFEGALDRLLGALDVVDGALGDLEEKLTQDVPQITGLAALAEVALQGLKLYRNFKEAEALASARTLAQAPQAGDFFDAADKLILINRAEAINDLIFAFGKFAPASVGPLKSAVTAVVDNFEKNFTIDPFIDLDGLRDDFEKVSPVYVTFYRQAEALTTAYSENSGHLTTHGNDTIYGDEEGEFIRLGGGNDVAFGGGGKDDLRGEGGQDDLRGEDGDDDLFGGSDRDSLYGGDNDDDLRGETGNDLLYGEADNDTLYGGEGEDDLFGGGGHDSLIGGADNDDLDGGAGASDVAIYQRSFAANYTITDLGGDRYEVTALTSDEGTDTLVRVEYLTFGATTKRIADWLAIQTPDPDPDPVPDPDPQPTPPSDPPYTPPPDPGLPSEGVSNTLLQVTVVSQSLNFGTSVGLSQMFPQASWIDNDGAYDIVAFALQDRTIGAGYLTYDGRILASGETHEFLLSEFDDIRFVAAGQEGVDQVGFNIIQADGDYSPSLPLGAVMTSIAPTKTRPPEEPEEPLPDPSESVAIIDIDNHPDGDEFDEDRQVKFTIERRGSLEGDIELAWRVFGIGSNSADSKDFVATSGTITMRDGDDEQTLRISLADDSIFEQDERFGIDIDIISGNAEFSDDDEQATILNDDILPPWGSGTDDHGNSLSGATLVSGESWAQGFIETPGDVDWFRFDLKGDGSYLIKAYGDNDTSFINGDSSNNAPGLERSVALLRREDGFLIDKLRKNDDALWPFERYEYELDLQGQPDQTVYLSVRENGGNDVGQYFVQAQVRIEPDDLPAEVTTPAIVSPGDIYYGFHERDNDDDWVRVDLQAGETYRFAVVNERRLLVDDYSGNSSLFYLDFDEPTLRLYDSAGGFVTQQNAAYPALNNLLQHTVAAAGTYYLSISDDGGERIREWALLFDEVPETPDGELLTIQGADVTTDVRFDSTRDLGRAATDDELLTTGDSTGSALRFDLDGLPDIATYAAIELFLTETSNGEGRTSDIVLDAPGDAWTPASLFGEVGNPKLITVSPAQSTGTWVTIPITELYNHWQSGEKDNNGILLTSSTRYGPRLSFHSSDANVDPAFKPKLVIQGPGIGAEVTGTFTADISEDEGLVSGAIGITSAFLPDISFANAAALGQYGSIAVNAAGDTWTYIPFASVQALDAGETVQDTLTIAASNGVAQQIAITLRGEDDPTLFVGATTVPVTTGAGIGNGGLSLFDVDGDDSPVFFASSYEGSRGTLVFETTGDWTYTVDESRLSGLTRGDTVQEPFDVSHSLGSDNLTINILVDTEINSAPVADAESFEVGEGDTLTIDVTTLLDGDTDPDGDMLTVVSVFDPVNGVVSLDDKGDGDASNDEVIFTPSEGFTGTAGFTYTVVDGFGGEDSASVVVAVMTEISGINLVGTGQADRLVGSLGNDTLHGGDGADTLIGGEGDDQLIGGTTATDLRDIIYAGAGNDIINGGYGNDDLYGMGGNDTFEGGFGADRLIGGDGDDVLTGSAFSDQIFGGNGFDFINGGFGSDRLNGGAGADRFFHVGVAGHGSDWIQDYSTAEGDVLFYGGGVGPATAEDFLVQFANAGSGQAGVNEAFITHIPSGNLLWALVDGAGQAEINIRIGGDGGDIFDLMG